MATLRPPGGGLPVLTGTSRSDRLAATADGQTVRGLGGDDFLASSFNGTRLVGDGGADTLETSLSYSERGSAPIEARQSGGSGADRMLVRLDVDGWSLDARLVLDGGAGDDLMATEVYLGESGPDGGGGTSTLRGGAGNDTIDAILIFDGFASGAVGRNEASGGGGDDQIFMKAISDPWGMGCGVTNLASGGAGADTISAEAQSGGNVGELARNEVSGGAGDDRISVTASTTSNDSGETAENLVFGGGGSDIIDVVTAAGWGYATQTVTVSGDGGDDRITASTGGGMSGMIAVVRLSGGAGNDTIESNAGIAGYNDYVPDAISNRLDGGSGNDTLSATIESPESEFMKPELGISAVNRLIGGGGNDALTARVEGHGRSLLDGGGGRDVLRVEGGQDNVLSGGGGADRLFAGSGTERMSGGGGVDDFVFDLRSNQASDRLVDFDGDADRLCFIGITDSGAKGLADDLDAILTLVDLGAGRDLELRFDSGSVLVLEGAGRGSAGWGTPEIDSIADLVADPARQLAIELV